MTNSMISIFREWLENSGRSSLTVTSYITDINNYITFLEMNRQDRKVILTRYLFNRFKEYLQERNQSVATINKAVNSLKVFNNFLIEQGILEQQIIVLMRDRIKIAYGSEAEVAVLTDIQRNQVLQYLMKDTERNRCIFLMLLYTGIRASELINVKIQDIERITVHGEGGEKRVIPLRQELLEAIEKYLQGERDSKKYKDSPFLFLI